MNVQKIILKKSLPVTQKAIQLFSDQLMVLRV